MRSKLHKVVFIAIPVLTMACSDQVSFKDDVNPFLISNCLTCHLGGEGSAKSGFSVQNYTTVMRGTKLGPVVVAGDSTSSTLYRLIDHKADPKIQMPPHHDESLSEMKLDPLSLAQVETIKRWIDQGAKDN